MSETIYIHPSILDRPEFIQNKYLSWYASVVAKAQAQSRKKSKDVYYEEHHILPQCAYPQYEKSKWNLVLLTAKEHFVCHHLLIKCTKGLFKRDMKNAFISFTRKTKYQERFYTANDYQILQKVARQKMLDDNPSSGLGDNHFNKGRKKSRETILKIRISKLKNTRPGDPIIEELEAELSVHTAAKAKKKAEEMAIRKSEGLKKRKPMKGKDNGNFKGWYKTPWGIFETLESAKEGCKSLMSTPIIFYNCKDSERIISNGSYNSSRYIKQNFPKSVIGSTYADLGFGFIGKSDLISEDFFWVLVCI